MRAFLTSLSITAALTSCSSILGIKDVTKSDGDDAGPCTTPGEMRSCYSGPPNTSGVGPCHDGIQVCSSEGVWGACEGEVVPQPERCGNGVDDNCSGQVDEDVDLDNDGFTTCQGDCCDSTECANPALVNPGAYDVPGNGVDDDCNGAVDDYPTCDTGLASDSTAAADAAKAMDLCAVASTGNRKWGLLDAMWTLTDGTGTPVASGHSIRTGWGTNVLPQRGASLAVISNGVAADLTDTNPAYSGGSMGTDRAQMSAFPADWYAAHNGQLPNTPGCPPPVGSLAYDPMMLVLSIRVPTNARSFSFDTNFYTMEFPEWVCSAYNDFLVVLLDSTYAGTAANPADKNLATYTNAQFGSWPVGVNLATLDKGLFVQCA